MVVRQAEKILKMPKTQTIDTIPPTPRKILQILLFLGPL